MIETVRLGARLIELIGGLVIGWAMLLALRAGASARFSDAAVGRMQQVMAQGVVGALGLMTAATLLKTMTLRSWSAIGMFAVVLALRTLVKRTLAAEVRSEPSQPLPAGEQECPSSLGASDPTYNKRSPASG